jgi:hypothetical protein
MTFNLCTTGYQYNNSEEANRLSVLGFQFETDEYGRHITDHHPSVEFSTLEELMDFVKVWAPLIIDEDSIEIYDDYRE